VGGNQDVLKAFMKQQTNKTHDQINKDHDKHTERYVKLKLNNTYSYQIRDEFGYS
jgi:hypothetical protein